MNKSRLLVTGGAGFIGSNFVRHVLKNYDEYAVINLDTLTYAGNQDNLKDLKNTPGYIFVKGDITSVADMENVMPGIDAVVHFAAESHVDRSIEDSQVFIKTNVLGTQILLESAKKHGIKRFIHVSTDEVYGSLGSTGLFNENSPLAPNSPYSASKAGGDLLVRAFHKTYEFPAIITRCSNNYGPYQFPEKFIPVAITNALHDKPIPVYGDGMNVRDWIYVEDHCAALMAVLLRGRVGEIYNIGGNNEWRNIDMARLILKEMGKPESLIRFVTDRPGHDRRYALDSQKIKKELGWQAETVFPDGIKKTVGWYVKHCNFSTKT